MKEEAKRDLLERSANRARAHLVETLEALDHRRHELMDVRGQIRAHWRPIAIVGGLAVVGLGTVIGVSIYWAATRRERMRRERWKALRRFWFHPDRLAREKPAKGSMAWTIAQKVLSATLSYAAVELAKRVVKRALPPLKETPRRTDVVVRTLPA